MGHYGWRLQHECRSERERRSGGRVGSEKGWVTGTRREATGRPMLKKRKSEQKYMYRANAYTSVLIVVLPAHDSDINTAVRVI